MNQAEHFIPTRHHRQFLYFHTKIANDTPICHSEGSEESLLNNRITERFDDEILRYAQNDKRNSRRHAA